MLAENLAPADTGEPADPVTVLITRRVKPGREAAYEARLEAMMAYTSHLRGYLGGTTRRPDPGKTEYTSVLNFASAQALHAFQHSRRRRDFAAEVAELVEAEPQWQQLSGMACWFIPPAGGPSRQPARWRMALVLTVVVYGLISVFTALLGPLLGSLPAPLRLLTIVALQVLAMTYLVMPLVTRLLGRWLF